MDSMFFISVVILAITQLIKMALPNVHGWLTIIVAVGVGVMVALFFEPLGLGETSLAEGIVGALGAIGISATAKKSASGE